MSLLTYKQYSVTKITADDIVNVLPLLQTQTPKDILDKERLERKAAQVVDYMLKQKHCYVVKDDSTLYGVVCLDVDKFVELEYLYSNKKYYNTPIGLLMNYVLNYVFPNVKVACESTNVSTFKSIVERVTKIADYYTVKDEFKEFVKRYQDG